MAKKIQIDVVTRLQDNGDGGYTMYVYNNEDELIENHPKCSDLEFVDGKLVNVFLGCSDELREKILNGYDEYEYGYIDKDTIHIEIDDDGNAKLSKPLSFHVGQ